MMLRKAICFRPSPVRIKRSCHKIIDQKEQDFKPQIEPNDTKKTIHSYPISFHVDYAEVNDNLINAGFTKEQAKCIKSILFNQNKIFITTTNELYELKNKLKSVDSKLDLQINTIRKDMVILEKSEFFLLRSENEKIRDQLGLISKDMTQNISRMRSNITVEFSLEKAKTREDIAMQEQRIKDTNNRIDTEMAKMQKDLEQQKSDLIKYILATLVSFTMLALGISRIVTSFT